MKTNQILNELYSEKFNNWMNWNTKELTDYIKANYGCSNYVAKNVAILFN
jgi:hypothetical protein